jgi:hypothetical protein
VPSQQSQPDTSTSSATPSLVSDDGTPEAPETAEQSKSYPMTASRVRTRPQITRPDPDPVLEAYFTRTGRKPSSQFPQCNAGDWRKWDWAELRPARWDIPRDQDSHGTSSVFSDPIDNNLPGPLRSIQWEHVSSMTPQAKEIVAMPIIQPIEVNNSHIWRPIATPDNPPFVSPMKSSTLSNDQRISNLLSSETSLVQQR